MSTEQVAKRIALFMNSSHNQRIAKTVMKYLNLTEEEAFKHIQIAKKFRFKSSISAVYYQNLLTLYTRHFTRDEILARPTLLRQSIVRQALKVDKLTEIGIKHLTPIHLDHFQFILYLKENVLKENSFIEPDHSVFEGLCDGLEINNEFRHHYRDQINHEQPVLEIRNKLITLYLKNNREKIGLSKTTLPFLLTIPKIKMLERLIRLKYLFINETAKIEAFTFSHGLFVDETLNKLPEIFGQDFLYYIIRMNMDFLDIPTDNLAENFIILTKEFGLNTQCIKFNPIGLDRCPEDFRFFLNCLRDEMGIDNMRHLHFLRLADYETDDLILKIRDLKQNHIEPTVTSILEFYGSTESAKRQKSSFKLRFLLEHLTSITQLSKESIRENWIYPWHYQLKPFHLQRMVDVIKYLDERGDITRIQLEKGIIITLYPPKMVKSIFEQLDSVIRKEWTGHPYLLHLIIYHIEKKFNFDGSAILYGDDFFDESIENS